MLSKNIGTTPMTNSKAAIGAAMRLVSPCAASSPNSGAAGTNAQFTLPGKAKAHSTKISTATATTLPMAKAAPDIAEASCALRAEYEIIALCSTSP